MKIIKKTNFKKPISKKTDFKKNRFQKKPISKKMSVLVFDTETTGLPLRNDKRDLSNPKDFEKYDKARLIEIAYKIISGDDNGLMLTYNTLVKNETLEIENSHIHGITTEMVLEEGKHICDLLDELLEDMKTYNVQKIVAHNIEFDINIVLAECYRYGKQDLLERFLNANKFCTMKEGQKLLMLQKYPKLTELYYRIFNKTFSNQHSALADCEACLECYIEMCKVGFGVLLYTSG